ncbi:hypothetical protein [Micromonospora sp. NPDC049497]|uniref:hypothetical protein n=1 Tax=Micromonospora sp. NPDC049497 TaxID=3364273 RepID=UPI0037BC5AE3
MPPVVRAHANKAGAPTPAAARGAYRDRLSPSSDVRDRQRGTGGVRAAKSRSRVAPGISAAYHGLLYGTTGSVGDPADAVILDARTGQDAVTELAIDADAVTAGFAIGGNGSGSGAQIHPATG